MRVNRWRRWRTCRPSAPPTRSESWNGSLLDADGEARTVKHTPRMTCGDFGALRDAAAAGLGVAFLPDHACRDLLEAGRLVRVFPDWSSRVGIVHVVFTTRRGLPPSVRALIDQLADAFRRGGITD
ncbi:LysR substrate-binding domain-containing protein [Caulobacter sp. UC70_42]|uniref:LysR substrate-binding domain-containing protein n=1 Tax=Caulobacter sp. UC70_42 TaxID=3374551 RepID=UPI003757ECB1